MAFSLRELNGLLLVLCAMLFPVALLSKDIATSGVGILLLAASFCALLYSFSKSSVLEWFEWSSFAAAIIGSLFLFLMLSSGRNLGFEVAGFILTFSYVLAGISMIYYSGRHARATEGLLSTAWHDTKAPAAFDEVNTFRKRDESDKLMQDYQIPEVKSQSSLTEFDDFKLVKKPDIGLGGFDFFDAKKNNMEMQDLNVTAELLDLYPEAGDGGKQKISKAPEDDRLTKVEVVELKEAPVLKIEKLQTGIQSKEGQKLDEKIRLIAEQAINDKNKSKSAKQATYSKRQSLKVYSTTHGSKYHSSTDCMSLSRVKKKDLVSHKSAAQARKNHLKPCGLCRQ